MVVYTHATWHVRPGHEDAFIEAWKSLAPRFWELGAGTGTLIRRVDDASMFVSFGPWPDMATVQAMREDPEAARLIAAIKEHCDDADPAGYHLVAQLEP